MSDPAGWEPLFRSVPGITLALAGAIVRLLNSTSPQTARGTIAALATAAFVGIALVYLSEGVAVAVHFKTFIIGLSGYCARDTLAYFARAVGVLNRRLFQSNVALNLPLDNIPSVSKEAPPPEFPPRPRSRRDFRSPRPYSGARDVRPPGEH